MALDALLIDGLVHGVAGVTLSVIDYTTSRFTNPKEDRIARKKQHIESIEALLDAENGEEGSAAKDSAEYAVHVQHVREYLHETGVIKAAPASFIDRMKHGLSSFWKHEKINNLSTGQKVSVAVGAEVVGDTMVGLGWYTSIGGPMAAFARNIYQIPAFFAGLVMGKYVCGAVDWFVTSSDERDLDKTRRALVKETAVVDVVLNYEAPEQVVQELERRGISLYTTQLTRAGAGLYKKLAHVAGTVVDGVRTAADSVVNYSERRERENEEVARKRKDRFDELTRGH
jgi:hypothetical protein